MIVLILFVLLLPFILASATVIFVLLPIIAPIAFIAGCVRGYHEGKIRRQMRRMRR